jgi:formylglycine-generating enzyme required for sulfatase activity
MTESDRAQENIAPDRPRNPYIAGKALGGRAGFFGRQAILDWVESELCNPNQNSLILYGQRRIGRTSILLQLERRLSRDSFCPVYFDFTDQASRSLGELLADLADALSEALALDSPDPAAFDDEGDYFQNEFLPRVCRGLRPEQRPVLLLDDLDILDATAAKGMPSTITARALYRYLGGLMGAEPRLALVIVIGWQRPEDFSPDFMATFSTSLSREVWVLDPDDARHLIRQANEDGSLQMDEPAVERILALTAGHPYLTQLLCQRVWERAHSAGEIEVGEEEVQAAIPDALQVCFNPLNWVWEGLSPTERIFSAAVAGTVDEGESMTAERVVAVLSEYSTRLGVDELELAPDALESRHVLEPAGDDAYRYAVELLRLWVAKHKPLRAVKRELERMDPLADDLFRAGRGYYDRRDWDGAIPRFREALGHNPRHFQAHLYLGEALLRKGDIPGALKTLQAACNLDYRAARPAFARGWLAMAESRKKAGDEEGVLKAYDVVLRLSPRNREAQEGRREIWRRRAEGALEDGDLGTALAAYRHAGDDLRAAAVEADLQERRIARKRTEAADLVAEQKWDEALAAYLELAELQPGVERWQNAAREIEAEQALAVLFQAGERALEAQKWSEAQRIMADIVARRPNYRHQSRFAAELLWRAVQGERSALAAEAVTREEISPAVAAGRPDSDLELERSPAGLVLVSAVGELALLDPLPERIVWKADRAEMVLVPGGISLMGSQEGREVEKPVHQVFLPAFYIDRVPVTNAQYRLFIGDGGYQRQELWTDVGWEWRERADWSHPRYWNEDRWNHPDLPVVGISWYEAVAYARWAGKRLPTEAEWEKAACWDPVAGLARRYPWGDEWDAERCNTKERKGFLSVFRDRGTSPVGQHSPDGDSPSGAADMAGNVWEWCSTRWNDYPYHPDDGREDLQGRAVRVLRGGSWATDAARVRSSIRVTGAPSESDYFRGFRCCCSPPHLVPDAQHLRPNKIE